MRFDAHIVLRQLLLGHEPPPFTPIQAFEPIGFSGRFHEFRPDQPSGTQAAAEGDVSQPPAAADSDK